MAFGLVTTGRGGSLARTECYETMNLAGGIFWIWKAQELLTFLLFDFEGCGEHDLVFGFRLLASDSDAMICSIFRI